MSTPSPSDSANSENYLEGYASMPRAIQRDPSISISAKMVYLTLASRANAQQCCWPSRAVIAEESSCSLSTVKRALKELRDRGLIWWETRHTPGTTEKTSNLYHLGSKVGSQGTTPPDGGGVTGTEGGSTETRGGVTQTPGWGLTGPITIQGNDTKNDSTESSPSSALPTTTPEVETEDDALVPMASVVAINHEGAFDQAWAAWPRKVGKGDARKAFKAALRKVPVQVLVDKITAYADGCKAAGDELDRQYIKHLSSWLNAEKWDDEVLDIPLKRRDGRPPEQDTWAGYGAFPL